MDRASFESITAKSSQAIKNSVYQNNRTTYTVESIFTNKVALTDALYRIALTKIKSA